MIAFTDKTLTVHQGDVLACLADMPDNSVHCAVTSPPYWGLRDYGVPGQLGLEATPDEFVTNMVAVCREVRRVLRPDGTFWLNIGDSYATGAGKVGDCPGGGKQGENWKGYRGTRPGSEKHAAGAMGPMIQPNRMPLPGLKPKDLCMIPERLALALQADGWYVRSEIIWAKPNPMPESVTDRPTKAHEKIYLLTKSERYFYDADAVREPHQEVSLKRIEYGLKHRHPADIGVGIPPVDTDRMGERFCNPSGRNLRTVWTMATQAYSEAHFATFPEELPRKCIMAGTSEKGVCPDCGAPWVRVVETKRLLDGEVPVSGGYVQNEAGQIGADGKGHWRITSESTTLGWRPGCKCGREDTVPATVLDPFGGSGTTGKVANDLGRAAVLIELNPKYIEMMLRRNRQPSMI